MNTYSPLKYSPVLSVSTYMYNQTCVTVSETKIYYATTYKIFCTTPATWLTVLHRIPIAIGRYLLQWEENCSRGQDDHGQQAVAQHTCNTAMRDSRDAHQVQQGMHGKAPDGTHPVHVAKMNFPCLE